MRLTRTLLLGVLLASPAGCQPPEPGPQAEKNRYLEQSRQSKSVAPSRIDARGLATTQFSNGGFESGDFAGWEVGDNGLSPLWPWSVCSSFSCGYFSNNEPIEGLFGAVNGFDGLAGYEAFLFQDIEVPAQGGSIALADRIQFDGFELHSALPRIYELELRDAADNVIEVLHHEEIFLSGQPYTDLGWRQRSFDVSAHAGETVRVYVRLFVPEEFTGPAEFEIDDVQLIPGDGGGGGDDVACELALAPGPAAAGAPFVLSMDFTNLGAAFDAKLAVLRIADGQVTTVHTDSGVGVSEGHQVAGFPVFSTLALDPFPSGAGYLVAVFDEASRALTCSSMAFVGLSDDGGANSAAAIRQLAQQYLDGASRQYDGPE